MTKEQIKLYNLRQRLWRAIREGRDHRHLSALLEELNAATDKALNERAD